MKILQIQLKNFRAFGTEEQTIHLKEGLNSVVGENSVGKSTILRFLEILNGSNAFSAMDHPNGNVKNKLRAVLFLELGEKETNDILEKGIDLKKVSPDIQDLRKRFSNRIRVTIDHSGGQQLRFQFIDSQNVPLTFLSPIPNLNMTAFNESLQKSMLELLRSKLKLFAEVRKRPGGKKQNIKESLDGEFVADVLANLKMGVFNERAKFEAIQNQFETLFPNLSIDVAGEVSSAPVVMIVRKNTSYEVPIDRVGAGIGEVVTLLTHLIGSQDMILGIDMPELHLHPHAQRSLLRLLEDNSKYNQIIVATHSPIFLNTKKLENITVIRDLDGCAKINQITANFFSPDEKNRLEKCLDAFNKDFFFSRKVFMVEGETELGALPVFGKFLKKDFDTFGISLVRTGKHFGLFAKLANALEYGYIIQCDKDAVMNIENSINISGKKVKTSPVFASLAISGKLTTDDENNLLELQNQIIQVENKLYYKEELFSRLQSMAEGYNTMVLSADFEGILTMNGYGQFMKDANAISSSKVTCGRIVAEKIVESNLKVPEEFSRIINLL
jgi:putative ATP-dependent endonuclease of the OLD family